MSFLCTDNFRWKTVSPLNKGPCARSYHSATVVGSKVVRHSRVMRCCHRCDTVHYVAVAAQVFFGGNDASKCYNDVYVLEYAAGTRRHAAGWTLLLVAYA